LKPSVLEPQNKPVNGLTSSNSLELSMEEAHRGFRVALVVLVNVFFEFCLDDVSDRWPVEGFNDLERRAEGGRRWTESDRLSAGAEGAFPGGSPQVVMEDDHDNRQKWCARGQCSGGIVKNIHLEPFQGRAEFRCDWLETQCSRAADVQSDVGNQAFLKGGGR
jgi:hypothetical protein